LLRPLLFLGAISSLANPAAGIGAVVRQPNPRPPLLIVQPPRQRVIFGPTSPPRFQLLNQPRTVRPAARLLLVQPPRLRVPFTGWPPGPKIFAGGRPAMARPLLLVHPPPPVGPFGPRPIQPVRFARFDPRRPANALLLVQPPRKPYFFQAGPLEAPRILRVNPPAVPARLLLQAIPRQAVTFPPGMTRPIQIGRTLPRAVTRGVLIAGPHRFPPTPPAPAPGAVLLPEIGYKATIIG
jgi:hypothetical protein